MSSQIAEISIEELAADGVVAQTATLIDVREPAEFAAGYIAGSRLIPLGSLAERLAEIPEGPVRVICRSGNRSAAAVETLGAAGITAAKVVGGVQAWSASGRPLARVEPRIIALETPTLGNRSYVVHDGEVAFVVDPQRDLDRVYAVLARAGVRLTDVFETHVHNDYLTGGVVLARETGARLHLNAADEVGFERTPISDGEVVAVGALEMRAIATPGHTFTHLSYALTVAGEEVGVFTGGSLLYGATGRPDLMGPDHTEALVRHQFHSARRLAEELPDDAEIFPTHGFGSFCSASQARETASESTIGAERATNPALTETEDTFVRDLLAGLDAFPAYYAHMGPGNAAGPGPIDLTEPQRATASDISEALAAGEWVVDLRDRTLYAAGHVRGSLNFGLDGQFATYLGWLIPWGTPLTLLAETPAQVAEAQRELVRIGIERPEAAATSNPEEWTEEALASFDRASFADLREVLAHRRIVVLDSRRDLERAEGWIEGSVHIPIHETLARLDEVPAGEVWVHCAGGYRASIVASVLAAAGRQVVAVDDEFAQAEAVGLTMVHA